MSGQQHVRVAVVQAAPVIMDREKTIDKIDLLVSDAAARGAKLVLLPEAFVPAYPRGLSFGTLVGSRTAAGRQDFARYADNAVTIPSKAASRIGDVARKHGVYLVIGVIESDMAVGAGTLYCTVLFYGPDGTLLAKHRKLKPTAAERLIWGEGDGSTLSTVETPYGTMGAVICWENYMPFVRSTMYAKGVTLYMAPTADSREVWQSTIRHIALEGRCFVLSCNQFTSKSMYPSDLACYAELESAPEILCPGGSAIVGPLGEYIAGPVYDKEETLIADLDLGLISQARFDFDVMGHYARPDVFQLIVDERKKESVTFSQKP